METLASSFRQLKLFSTESPLVARLGVEFFRGLPEKPGVYFFHDDTGRLLYIGQSGDLKARLGSYRHVTPEKNPKRTLRLIHRTHRIQWKACKTAREAIKLEATLLLEHRPPFNRAGVWQGAPWWLRVEVRRLDAAPLSAFGAPPSGGRDAESSMASVSAAIVADAGGLTAPSIPAEAGAPNPETRAATHPDAHSELRPPNSELSPPSVVHLTLLREAPAEETEAAGVIGPLPSGFRHALGSLVRCLHRRHRPDLPLTLYPHGLFAERSPLNFMLGLPGLEMQALAESLSEFARGRSVTLLEDLVTITAAKDPEAPTPQELYWQEEVKGLVRFARKLVVKDAASA